MMLARHRILLLWLLLLPLTGCLLRSHKVERRLSTAQLKSATQQELISVINSEAEKLKTLNATVDIDTAVGGAKKGKVTEYKEIRGYLLVRTPDMLRFVGLLPIVRNRAFDMVSNGKTFRLWVPPKNRFYIGSNDVVRLSANPLENIRPQIIYDALLLRPIDSKDQIAVLEGGIEIVKDPKSHKDVDQPDYILNIIRRESSGWRLERKIIFSRTDLNPHRQIIFDKQGNIATDVHYGEFKDYNGVQFPSVVQITRPQEEYEITLGVVKMTINQPVSDQQFAMTQPPGAQVINLDTANNRASDNQPK
jgi:outer membrane lipoprotein-sorting protein